MTTDLLDNAGMLPPIELDDLGRALDALATLESLRWWPDGRLRVLRRVREGRPLGALAPERLTVLTVECDAAYRTAATALRDIAGKLEDPDADEIADEAGLDRRGARKRARAAV